MAPVFKLFSILALLSLGMWGGSHLLAKPMPEHATLTTVSDGKFGSDYKAYFIDATHENNNSWWTWSFNNRWQVDFYDNEKKSKLSNDFKDTQVESAFSKKTSDKSLNQACKKAYEKTETELKGTTNHEENTWRYCSKFGYKPKSLQEDSWTYTGSESNVLGNSKKSILIAVSNVNNKTNLEFWKLKQEEFFGLNGKTALGSQATANSYFKKFYDDNKDRKSGREQISGACEKAYSKSTSTSSSESAPTQDEAIKYCTLKGKE